MVLAAKARFFIIFLSVVVTVAALSYVHHHLGMNTDTAGMLSGKLPIRVANERYKQQFPQYVDTLLLVIDAATEEQTLHTRNRLVEQLNRESTLFPSVYVPGGGGFFERQALLYLDTDALEQLADRLARIQPFLGELTHDPSLRGLFYVLGNAITTAYDDSAIDLGPALAEINVALEARLADQPYRLSWQELMQGKSATREQHRQLILVQPALDYSRLLAGDVAMSRLRAMIAEAGVTTSPDVSIRITGEVALAHEELESVSRGARLAGILALAMVFVVLMAGLRSPVLVFATLASLVVGLSLTALFATLAIGHLNLISVAFAVLYIGLGVDFSIHLCLRYQELVTKTGQQTEALRMTGRRVGVPLAVCGITTAIGFYAFIPTDFKGVSELGVISGTGMFISFLVTLTLVPAILSLVSVPVAGRYPVRKSPPGILAFTRLPWRYPFPVLVGAALAAVAALWVLPDVRFDYNTLDLRDPHSESVHTFNALLSDSRYSPWTAIAVAKDRAEMESLRTRLEALHGVDHVVTLDSFVPEDQDYKLDIIDEITLLLGPDPVMPAGRTPVDAAAQIRALRDFIVTLPMARAPDPRLDVEVKHLRSHLHAWLDRVQAASPEARPEMIAGLQDSLLATLPGNLERLHKSLGAEKISLQTLPPSLVRRWLDDKGNYRIEIFPAHDLNDTDALRRFVQDVQAVAPDVIGAPVVNMVAGTVVIRAFQQAFVIALTVIVLLLALLLRNFLHVIYVITPLLLAGLLTAAFTVLINLPFNFANVIALPLLLGIGIDNGIHMVHRASHGIPANGSLLTTSTARAVIYSALTTIAGFGTLSLSPHPGTASLGILLTTGVLLTLVTTLLVLPALLHTGLPRPPARGGLKP